MTPSTLPAAWGHESVLGGLVEQARWTDRLPHEGTLQIVLSDDAAKAPLVQARADLERTLSRPGFRRGAKHLPRAYLEDKWTPRLEGHIRRLAMEALEALAPHLGAKPLDPIPEVVGHTDPLADAPLALTLKVRLHPAPPDPLLGDQVWPPDPSREALRQAAGATSPAPTPGAPAPGLPALAPPDSVGPAVLPTPPAAPATPITQPPAPHPAEGPAATGP